VVFTLRSTFELAR
jgi:hypothetical protein